MDRIGADFEGSLKTMETRLGASEYLAGADYSIADIAAWPWARSTDVRGIDIAAYPKLARWIDAIAERPAIQHAMAAVTAMKRHDPDKFAQEHPDKLDRYLGRGRYSRIKAEND